VENGAAISNNLSANQVAQQFETPIRVFQIEQKRPWTEERPIGHKTPHATLIIHCEVQIVKHISALTICYKIPRRKNIKLKMQTHRLSLDKGVENLNLDKKLCWNQQI